MLALEGDIIDQYDKFAIELHKERRDQDVYEFDLTLWSLLKLLAINAPFEAKSQFDLTESVVEKLAAVPESRLKFLASGVLLSFKLKTNESDVIDILSRDYNSAVCLQNVVDDFDAAYWLLLNKVASKNLEMAVQAFGVSEELATAVVFASYSQLRSMSHQVITRFLLRFDIGVLDKILSDGPYDTTSVILHKIQQTLVWR